MSSADLNNQRIQPSPAHFQRTNLFLFLPKLRIQGFKQHCCISFPSKQDIFQRRNALCKSNLYALKNDNIVIRLAVYSQRWILPPGGFYQSWRSAEPDAGQKWKVKNFSRRRKPLQAKEGSCITHQS
eukprot:749129-Hanusia_phi.AAC.4